MSPQKPIKPIQWSASRETADFTVTISSMNLISSFRILHLGGERCVTGSCRLVQVRGQNILVDCGMVQGQDASVPIEKWPVKPAEVDFIFFHPCAYRSHRFAADIDSAGIQGRGHRLPPYHCLDIAHARGCHAV